MGLNEYEPENCPDIPEEVVNGNGVEEEDPELEEIMTVPKETPIYVNTQSGRSMLVQFSENCLITATLREDETTADVAKVITSLVLMMASARYGGVKEHLDELRKLQKGMEVSGA